MRMSQIPWGGTVLYSTYHKYLLNWPRRIEGELMQNKVTSHPSHTRKKDRNIGGMSLYKIVLCNCVDQYTKGRGASRGPRTVNIVPKDRVANLANDPSPLKAMLCTCRIHIFPTEHHDLRNTTDANIFHHLE